MTPSVGDHKQLPPVSLVNDADARKKYNRSLMERFCDVSPTFSTLTVQYRMHKSIQDIVSALNYGGLLTMGDIERRRQPAVIWHDSKQCEEPVGVSFKNTAEAEVCEEVYLRERDEHPEQSIMLIVRSSEGVLVILSSLRCASYNIVHFNARRCGSNPSPHSFTSDF